MSWRRFLLNVTLLVVLVYPLPCLTERNHQCPLSSCGNIQNISYPFRLQGDPQNCGDPRYELVCENNQTVLNLYNGKYSVQTINYNNSTIRVTDLGIRKDNCSSIPLYTLTHDNFSSGQPFSLLGGSNLDVIAFMSCEVPIISPLYIDIAACTKSSSSSISSFTPNKYNFAVHGDLKISELEASCSVLVMVMTSNFSRDDLNLSYSNLHQNLVDGLQLSWGNITCHECEERGYGKLNYNNEVIACARSCTL